MANLRTTADLKAQALKKVGELTNGNSDYDSDALLYLNEAYQALFSAGNEFDPELDEPWIWAQAQKPLVITLLPPYETGSVTLTNGSRSGSFSVAPALSQEGRFLKIQGRDEYFRIRSHDAAATAFVLDQEYTEASGTFGSFKSIPLEYELVDDRIVVDSASDKVDFAETIGVPLVATLTHGVYTTSTILTELITQLNAAGAQTYTVTFDSSTRKFTVGHGGPTLQLLLATGANRNRSFLRSINFSVKDHTGGTSYESEIPLNAIHRLAQPITTYRRSPAVLQEDPVFPFRRPLQETFAHSGKIFELDRNTLLRDYPLVHIQEGTPSHYAKVAQTENGKFTLQFNRYVKEETRIEVTVIPEPLALQDNAQSVPLIPLAYRSFLVYATAYYLAVDKSDNKAQAWFQLAQSKLRALQNHNRKDLSLAGNNYGRIIPRRGN